MMRATVLLLVLTTCMVGCRKKTTGKAATPDAAAAKAPPEPVPTEMRSPKFQLTDFSVSVPGAGGGVGAPPTPPPNKQTPDANK